jgi:hypothetical protein
MPGKHLSPKSPEGGALIKIYLSSHDNDRKIPRTVKEIYGTNGIIAKEMENIFLKRGVPVIPSLGRRVS